MFLVLLLCSIVPPQDVPRVYWVDVVEVNEIYDSRDGKKMFNQVILWSWSDEYEDFVVRDYASFSNNQPGMTQDVYGLFRFRNAFIRAGFYKHTASFSEDDPEVLNRQILPEEKREKIR
jgi:hypothetical protein